MKNMAETQFNIGKRGSTPFFFTSNFDLQQFCSPLRYDSVKYFYLKSQIWNDWIKSLKTVKDIFSPLKVPFICFIKWLCSIVVTLEVLIRTPFVNDNERSETFLAASWLCNKLIIDFKSEMRKKYG